MTPIRKIIAWLRQRWTSLIAGFAVLILPFINYYLWPPTKGIMILAELVVLAGWILYLLGPRSWRECLRRRLPKNWKRLARPRGNHWKELAKGFGVGISIAGALALLMPTMNKFYSIDNLTSNLFAAEPCTINNNRAVLAVDGTGLSLTAAVDIIQPPQRGEFYWIVSYSYTSTPQSYFAKKKLTQDETTHGHHGGIPITLRPDTGNGSTRTLSVVCADSKKSTELEMNYLDDENGAAKLPGDRRRSLPDGVMKVSNGFDNMTQ
ncbi:MAG: hypothetical protein ACRDTC_27855 [Pseudonocardiaceae bacterium]